MKKFGHCLRVIFTVIEFLIGRNRTSRERVAVCDRRRANLQHSRKFKCERYPRGFTLIELLVVITIVSILSSVALFSMNRNENRELDAFTKELVQRISLAQEQAMLQPMTLGLKLTESSYQFASYHPSLGNKKNTWIILENKILGTHHIPNHIGLVIQLAGQQRDFYFKNENKNYLPQVIISTTGDITPFTLYVGKKGEKPRYLIQGEASGRVTSNRLLS